MSEQAARRLYRLLLRLGPRALRQRHGEEMEELFLLRRDEARTRGLHAGVAAWARAVADLGWPRFAAAAASNGCRMERGQNGGP